MGGQSAREHTRPGENSPPKQWFSFRDFLGMNTRANRTTLDEKEFALLQNYMPLGPANMKPVKAPVTDLESNNKTVFHIEGLTVNSTPFVAQFNGDGSVTVTEVNAPALHAANISSTVLSGAGTRGTVWTNAQYLIIDATGYFSWDGNLAHTTVAVTGNAAPTSGIDIAVYAGRVWIASGRTVTFSAPDSYTDFTAANGGGSFAIRDSTMQANITRLFVANGYLYIFSANSIDVVSDVRVPSGANPPTPIFTRVNINPVVGTDQPDAVTSYERSVAFANRFGFWTLDGVTVTRISNAIDDTITQIDYSVAVSAGQAIVNNILCACFAFLWRDPSLGGGSRPIIACYFDGRWWFADQTVGAAAGVTKTLTSVTQVTTVYYAGVPSLCQQGYDSANVSRLWVLFQNGSPISGSELTYIAKTALWDRGDAIKDKQVLKAGIEALLLSGASAYSVNITVDSERDSAPASINLSLPLSRVTWLNNSSAVVTWTNNGAQTVIWYAGLPSAILNSSQDVDQYGKYVGITMTTKIMQVVPAAFDMEYELRARW